MTAADKKELAQARREKNKATLAALKQHYPAAFAKPTPLAVGLGQQLLEAAASIGLSKKTIRLFLGAYTRCNDYLKALAHPNSFRVDLEGNMVEAVEQQHQDKAKLTLRARVKAKQKNPAKAGKRPVVERLTPPPTKPRNHKPETSVNNGSQLAREGHESTQIQKSNPITKPKKAENKPKIQVSKSGRNILTLG